MAIYQSKEGTVDHYLKQIKSKFMESAVNGNLIDNYTILATIMEDCVKQLHRQSKNLS